MQQATWRSGEDAAIAVACTAGYRHAIERQGEADVISYATVGSNDVEKAKRFYDPLLETIGMKTFFDHPAGGRLYGRPDKGLFGVLAPYDGQSAGVGNGAMAGFGLDSREAVAAFHAKALSLGAVNEGDPGPRFGENSPAYFAYFRDLDGNKLCAYHFTPRG